MGHRVPFKPEGTCKDCKFSNPLKPNHWQSKFHTLVCKRFPPKGAGGAPGDGPWSHETYVHDITYCAEWRAE